MQVDVGLARIRMIQMLCSLPWDRPCLNAVAHRVVCRKELAVKVDRLGQLERVLLVLYGPIFEDLGLKSQFVQR